MNSLPLAAGDCWNRIGVHGDRSCGELDNVVHCHHCHVFAQAGRRFLDAAAPPGYRREWTERLARPLDEAPADLTGVLIFRLAEEWLALPVAVLVEVTTIKSIHRVPPGHLLDGKGGRAGVLAGLVNIRGELHLAAHLHQVLGIQLPPREVVPGNRARPQERLLVTKRDSERWVFRVDEVDRVHRLCAGELTKIPATVSRAAAHLTLGVFDWQERSVGLIDDEKLFGALRQPAQQPVVRSGATNIRLRSER
jgi:chemotaxis-related protein WspD